MPMKMKIIPKEKQTTTEWSGGTTTQLYIYPENGNYTKKDFDFRVSTAVCKDEYSVFTLLNGVQRKLMVLDGKIVLTHDKEKEVILAEGEQDSFSGEAYTESKGICTDFNLMLKNAAQGSLAYLDIERNNSVLIDYEEEFLGLYVYKGEMKIVDQENEILVNEHDFAMIDATDKDMIEIKANKDTRVVIVRVSC